MAASARARANDGGRRENVMTRRLHAVSRWLYRGGRPGRLARAMNRLSAVQFAAGLLSPRRAMTLEVTGRRSGRPISLPVVVADHEGQRYLVSMLGENAQWVRNVRAAGGRAVLRRHGRQDVSLEEVEPALRAPILRRYLQLAPGARPHLPVRRDAPLGEFERIASRYPVFRINPIAPARRRARPVGQRRLRDPSRSGLNPLTAEAVTAERRRGPRGCSAARTRSRGRSRDPPRPTPARGRFRGRRPPSGGRTTRTGLVRR